MSPVALYLFLSAAALFTGDCQGNSVSQAPAAVTLSEGDNVRLFCNYTATHSNDPNLFWYRQHPSGSMEYLLQRTRYIGNKERFPGDRFSAELNHSIGTVPLKVSETELADSAVYYCALRPTETRGWAEPVQKLSESLSTSQSVTQTL